MLKNLKLKSIKTIEQSETSTPETITIETIISTPATSSTTASTTFTTNTPTKLMDEPTPPTSELKPNYKLLIDYREQQLIMELNNIESIKFEICNLKIGDIVITNNDKYEIVIERKTLKDLESSIKDGRYKEQKIRLLNYENNPKILYLIESKVTNINKIIDSSFIGMILRDNINIIYSYSVNHSSILINKIFEKHILFSNNNNNNSKEYVNSIKSCKKENINPDNCFIIQLAQIPGFSISIGTKIKEKYNNMYLLTKFINEQDKTFIIKELSNIQLEKRKLGKILAEKLYSYYKI